MAAMRLITTGFLSLPLACRQGGVSGSPVTFPVSFPSLVLGALMTLKDENNGDRIHWEHVSLNSLNNSGFSFNGGNRYYTAIGY